MDADELLHAARDEIHHARGLLAHARNRTKLETAAFSDSLARMEALSEELDAALRSPRPKEAQGNGKHQAHLKDSLAAA